MTKASKRTAISDPARKQAVIYARVSSKEQEKEGFSSPAQLKLLRELLRIEALIDEDDFLVDPYCAEDLRLFAQHWNIQGLVQISEYLTKRALGAQPHQAQKPRPSQHALPGIRELR